MLVSRDIRDLIDAALAEDVGQGDPTTDALIEPGLNGSATLVSREDGVIAGIDVAVEVFTQFDQTLDAEPLVKDGSSVIAGEQLASVSGSMASILKAERTAVNFLQHLSGVATMTRRYVDAVQGFRAQIVDTRKTTPGLRKLEKHAVEMGGGRNHRYNLGDGILIKDNHIEAMALQGIGIGDVVKRAHARASHMIKVEIEVETLEQLEEVLKAGADLVLLDNMGPEQMETAVSITDGRALLEASGGITFETVREVAGTGVDIISVGALTHSAPALNISLDMVIDN
ncbi:MAG: carboxylating nicotinate-nucleotide diphosphorylase [Dehalococcoidia bacterium]|nr:carboxylating nicotinate-nucleotide diphosphorylase [Dehalococcoidia bacterium]